MSWLGTHPLLTRAQARAMLPLRACRRCVHLFRVLGRTSRGGCTRCGTRPRGIVEAGDRVRWCPAKTAKGLTGTVLRCEASRILVREDPDEDGNAETFMLDYAASGGVLVVDR